MGSKNSRSFNQATLDMLKNGNLNNFDLNQLMSTMQMQAAQVHSSGAFLASGQMNPCQPMFYPPKPPRQQQVGDMMTTGSLAAPRLTSMPGGENNKYVSKSNTSLNQIEGNYRNKKYEGRNLVYDGSTNASSSSPTPVSGGGKKESSPVPSKTSLLQELLECPICMNLYDNPYVLPCQHTFCKKCIVSLQNSDSNRNNLTTIDCPICREKHTLANGVDSLTANYTMKRLIELDAMAAKEKEKLKEKEKEKEKEREMEREKLREKSKAKCFSCQKFSYLKVCDDCSYMLCFDCIENPDHELIIGKISRFFKFIY